VPGSHSATPRNPKGPNSKSLKLSVLAGLLAVVVVGAFGYSYVASKKSPRSAITTSPSTTTSASSNSAPVASTTSATCPLTDLPAPNGMVPQRPALAVKVGNDPAARPQSGLQEADIVYEVQVEGGITRYIAVFQCNNASAIGPVRSLRWTDWHVIEPLGKPIIAFAGGINPDRYAVSQKPYLFDADFFRYINSYYRISTRAAPENLYTSTKNLYALDPSTTPPNRIFTFQKSVPSGGTAVTNVYIPFSYAAQVNWTWSSQKQLWLRSYGSQPDLSSSGAQQNATNVVVQMVQTIPGPYVETGTNVYGVHSITIGTGPVMIFRNGREYTGYWSRPNYAEPTQYYLSSGTKIPLAPGRTWVELVPNTVAVSVS
jgi:hypothetical protein